MHNFKLALLFAAVFTIAAMSAAMVYARDSDDTSSSMMRGGMMGRGMMKMSRMMGHCGDMMGNDRDSGRPNEQWRDGQSPAPDHHD